MAALFRNRYSAPAPDTIDPTQQIANKTIIITGSNTGLGLQAAQKYTEHNAARVILGVRNTSKGEAAKNTIEAATNRKNVIDVWELNYDSYASIKAFAAKVESELDTVDIVVLNAGVTKAKFELSPNGWEETVQVNVLSTVLLALLLMPKLRDSWREEWTPRLSIVGSGTHLRVQRFAGLDEPNVLQSMNQPENFGGLNVQYGRSKLCVAFAVNEIAEIVRVKYPDENGNGNGGARVVVNHSCPGMCQSDLGREFKTTLTMKLLTWAVFSTVAKTAEEGSRSLVKASLIKPGKGEIFLRNDAYQEQGPLVLGEEGKMWRKKVWKNIVEELSLIDDDIKRVMEDWSGVGTEVSS